MAAEVSEAPILRVEDLQMYITTPEWTLRAVNGISFDVRKGEALGIVGESGSGKTMLALSMIGHPPPPYGRIVGGRVLYRDTNLLDARGGAERHRQPYRVCLRESGVQPRPLLPNRRPDRRDDSGARSGLGDGGQAPRSRAPGARRDPRPDVCMRCLSASIQRRNAAACGHRDRAELQSGNTDCRQSHERPGRHDSEPDRPR